MKIGKQYLRAADIAELTGMSLRSIRRWIADDVLASTKLGGARLVAKAEVERLLSPHTTSIRDHEEYGDEFPSK